MRHTSRHHRDATRTIRPIPWRPARRAFTLIEPFDADSVGAQGKLPFDRLRTSRPAVRKCKACGFTLIELLVVIAIIALLVAILMPSLQRAQELAQRAKCGVQLRSIGIAINMYADENEEWLPFAIGNPGIGLMMHDDNVWRGVFPGGPHRLGLLYCQPPPIPGWAWWRFTDFTRAVYVDQLEVFRCPSRKYAYPPQDDINAGYSHCMPMSVFYHNTIGYIDFKRDQQPVWPYPWGNGGVNLQPYVVWAACYREDGTYPAGSPHMNIGVNATFRDGSARFVYRPEAGWGSWGTGTDDGNLYDASPIWAVIGQEFGR